MHAAHQTADPEQQRSVSPNSKCTQALPVFCAVGRDYTLCDEESAKPLAR